MNRYLVITLLLVAVCFTACKKKRLDKSIRKIEGNRTFYGIDVHHSKTYLHSTEPDTADVDNRILGFNLIADVDTLVVTYNYQNNSLSYKIGGLSVNDNIIRYYNETKDKFGFYSIEVIYNSETNKVEKFEKFASSKAYMGSTKDLAIYQEY